jgi:hypothetical protein
MSVTIALAQTPLLRSFRFSTAISCYGFFSPWRREVGIGVIFPGMKAVFDRMSIGMTSIPIAIRADPGDVSDAREGEL